MGWTHHLFRFGGRIGRAGFWFGLLALFCGMIVLLALGALLGRLSGGDGSFSLSADDIFVAFDPAAWPPVALARLPLVIVKLAATVLLAWVYLALSIKRLHDRDRSGWWMVPFFILPGLYDQFYDRLPDSHWMLAPGLAASVLCLWGFIELGFLRGSPHANRFGADPLAGAQPDSPDSATSASRATDDWDQQSALEFVPHSASPSQGMHVKRSE